MNTFFHYPMKYKLVSLLLINILYYINPAIAQPNHGTSAPTELFNEIKRMDSLAFATYNARDLEAYRAFFTDDVEFYHDQDGLIAPLDTLMAAFKIFFRPERPTRAVRELVQGSLRVYPIAHLGAIQLADHRFYEVDKEGNSQFSVVGKLYVIWKKTDGGWKLSRVVSYDHHPPTQRERIEDLMAKRHLPMVGVAVITNDSIAEHLFKSGKCDDCPDGKALFNVASMTKPVVTMTALKLVADKKLTLKQPLYEYFIDPDLKQDRYLPELTVEHVLRHETGFPNWRGSQPLKFGFRPGSKHQYSGEGFEYLRKTLEAKFQTPLETLVDSLTFDPAGITDAYFTRKKLADTARVVSAYDSSGANYHLPLREEANAADDLLISAGDYARFGRFVIDQAKTGTAPFGKLFDADFGIEGMDDVGYGLGWFVIKKPSGESVLFHSGGDWGVKSFVMLDVKNRRGLVVLTSSDRGAKAWKLLTESYMPEFLPFLKSTGLK